MIQTSLPQCVPKMFLHTVLVQKEFEISRDHQHKRAVQVHRTSSTMLTLHHVIANKCNTFLQTGPVELHISNHITRKFLISKSPRENYAYNLARPPSYNSLSAATTSMGNLSVAALAPAPASGQDQGNVKGKGRRHNRSRSPPQEGRHRKRHNRSRSPPKEGRHGKRQTGDEARKNLQSQYEQGNRR